MKILLLLLSLNIYAETVVVSDYMDGIIDLDLSENHFNHLFIDNNQTAVVKFVQKIQPDKKYIIPLFSKRVFEITKQGWDVIQPSSKLIDYLHPFAEIFEDLFIRQTRAKEQILQKILKQDDKIIIFCSTYKYSFPLYVKLVNILKLKNVTFFIRDLHLNRSIPSLMSKPTSYMYYISDYQLDKTFSKNIEFLSNKEIWEDYPQFSKEERKNLIKKYLDN